VQANEDDAEFRAIATAIGVIRKISNILKRLSGDKRCTAMLFRRNFAPFDTPVFVGRHRRLCIAGLRSDCDPLQKLLDLCRPSLKPTL